MSRPRIVVPARFSESASALRYRAEVTSRALVEAVWAAGGEPLMIHPVAAASMAEVAERLSIAEGVLLPGGGDLAAHWTGQEPHPSLYDVDETQDAFDLAVARFALTRGVPLLAICRGLQVVNAALGGTIVQDMAAHHRHRVHAVRVEAGSALAKITDGQVTVSCYHHQCLDRLAGGLRVVATAEDGVIEAVELDDAAGWFLGVQWHPEDQWADVPAELGIFEALVAASAG
jgi:putative glutamine amidotransferase